MNKYVNVNNDSGIVEYEYNNSSITIRFARGGVYVYDVADIGQEHLENMKRLADGGDGLNSYINRNRDVHSSGCKLS